MDRLDRVNSRARSNNFSVISDVLVSLKERLDAGNVLTSTTPVFYRGRTEEFYRFTKKWNAYASTKGSKYVDPDYFTRVTLSKGSNFYEVVLEYFENAFSEDTILIAVKPEDVLDMLKIFCSSQEIYGDSGVIYTRSD